MGLEGGGKHNGVTMVTTPTSVYWEGQPVPVATHVCVCVCVCVRVRVRVRVRVHLCFYIFKATNGIKGMKNLKGQFLMLNYLFFIKVHRSLFCCV